MNRLDESSEKTKGLKTKKKFTFAKNATRLDVVCILLE